MWAPRASVNFEFISGAKNFGAQLPLRRCRDKIKSARPDGFNFILFEMRRHGGEQIRKEFASARLRFKICF
jgi:hypothetical protein